MSSMRADAVVDGAAALAAGAQAVGDVLRHGHVREQGVVLEDDADVALVGRQMVDGGAVDQHAAGRLADEARDDAQQGGLAAARRPEQGHDLARLDGERDAVDGQRLAVADGQVVDVERARRGPGRGRRRLSAVDRLHAACLLRPEGGKARAKPVKPGLAELAHRHGGIGHAVGEAPFVVVPAHDPDERAVHDLGLVHVEGRRVASRG